MKKIIALAVAGAFAAPAMAADISVSGEIEYVYVTGGSSDASVSEDTNVIVPNDTMISVAATEEVNGLTITGTINVVDDTDDTGTGVDTGFYENDGSNLAVSGAFGTVTIGDTSGALDSVGDYTDIAPYFGGFALDGDDAQLKYTLPTIQGLTVNLAYSPEDDAELSKADSTHRDAQGASAKYSFGPGEVYYGTNTIGSSEASAYGVKISMNGFFFAVEAGEEDGQSGGDKSGNAGVFSKAGGELEYMSYAGSYTIGDVKVGFEKHNIQEAGNDTDVRDQTVMFAEYNLGSNVDIYVSTVSEQGTPYTAATTAGQSYDQTAVGIEYNF